MARSSMAWVCLGCGAQVAANEEHECGDARGAEGQPGIRWKPEGDLAPTEGRLYVTDRTRSPPSCLPLDFDWTDIVDVTSIGDQWRRYMNLRTGRIHDGAVYFAEAQRLTEER